MGLHPVHVRRLVREGEIPAHKVGGRWLVTESAVRQRDRLAPSPGRPVSSNMAWAILKLVDPGLRASGDVGGAAAIEGLGDRRSRHRLRQLIWEAPPSDRWAAWLRRRARPQRVWAHPGALERIALDPRLHLGGEAAAAAAEVGVGAGVGTELVLYLDRGALDGVLGDYRGRPDPEGQLLLMVIPDDVADELRPGPGPVAPAVALVDLLSSSDARQRHLAAELLGAAARAVKPAPSQS